MLNFIILLLNFLTLLLLVPFNFRSLDKSIEKNHSPISNSKTAILLHKPLFESKDAVDLSILLRLVQINDASYGHH